MRTLYVSTEPARLAVLHAAVLRKYPVRPSEGNVPAVLLYPDPASAQIELAAEHVASELAT